MEKIKVAILFGGKSTEHEISLRSAKSIIEAIDRNRYEVQLIGIDKTGKWHLNEESHYLLHADDASKITLNPGETEIYLTTHNDEVTKIDVKTNQSLGRIDVVFPIIHGAFGEDGSLQGLLRALNIPFVGVDILASAVGMDKDVTKRLLRDAGIPIAKFFTLHKHNPSEFTYEQIVAELGSTLFVKPANAGSSVGVHKVKTKESFQHAIADAFQFDRKILVEEAIVGREVECAVLGNENPVASVIGEIIPMDDFYSYDAKYISSDGAKLEIPAKMDPGVAELIQTTAIKAFQVICGEGLSRVDFFLRPDNTLVLNEINTMPGFTSISMFPKLFEASGIPYRELIDILIRLAIERHQKVNSLITTK
jgi:D-alanine-D-alanine ligase